MTSTSTESTPDLIPLAAAAVALGYTPASASVLASQGRFPVPVQKAGRYNVVARADIEAELQRRPHITKAQHEAVIKAHKQLPGMDAVPPARPDGPVAELLAQRLWLTTADVARALGIHPDVVKAKAFAGTLPFKLEKDPHSTRGGYRAASSDVAAFLVTQEPAWPTAEDFAAVPSLSLAEVKRALGDDTPAGADDPVTQAYLRSRETISTADFALMLGIAPDALKQRLIRLKKAKPDELEAATVEYPATKEKQPKTSRAEKARDLATKNPGYKRTHRRIRSDYAAKQLRSAASDD